MAQQSKDLTGRTFGRLTVLHRDHSQQATHTLWHCACSCGGFTTVSANHLITGNTRSCGCLSRSRMAGLSADMRGELVKTWRVVRKATEYERKKVIGLRPSNRQLYWLCKCTVCKKETFFGGQAIRQGRVRQCKHSD